MSRLKRRKGGNLRKGKVAAAPEVSEVAVTLSSNGDVVSASSPAVVTDLAAGAAESSACWYWPYCFGAGLSRPDVGSVSRDFSARIGSLMDAFEVSVSGSTLSVRSSDSFVANPRMAVVQVLRDGVPAYRVTIYQQAAELKVLDDVSLVEIPQEPAVSISPVTGDFPFNGGTVPINVYAESFSVVQSGSYGSVVSSRSVAAIAEVAAGGFTGFVVGRSGAGDSPIRFLFRWASPEVYAVPPLQLLYVGGVTALICGYSCIRLRNVDVQSAPVVSFAVKDSVSGIPVRPFEDAADVRSICIDFSSVSAVHGMCEILLWFSNRVYCSSSRIVGYLDFGRFPQWALMTDAVVADPNNSGAPMTAATYLDWSLVELQRSVPISVDARLGGLYLSGKFADGSDSYSPQYSVYNSASEDSYAGDLSAWSYSEEPLWDDFYVPTAMDDLLVVTRGVADWPVAGDTPESNSVSIAEVYRRDGEFVSVLPVGVLGGFTYYSQVSGSSVASFSLSSGVAAMYSPRMLNLKECDYYYVKSRVLSGPAGRMVKFDIGQSDVRSPFHLLFSPVLLDGSEGHLSDSDAAWDLAWSVQCVSGSVSFASLRASAEAASVYLCMGLSYYVYIWSDSDLLFTADVVLSHPLIAGSGVFVAQEVLVTRRPTLLPFGEVRFDGLLPSGSSLPVQISSIVASSSGDAEPLEPADAYIRVIPNSYTFPAEGGVFRADLDTNVDDIVAS